MKYVPIMLYSGLAVWGHDIITTPITFDRTLTMEWLNAGQHIQKYAVEINRNGKWMQVFQGNAIGHKRIDHFAPVTASRVRLNILSSSAEAHIREFQLFESKGDSKEDAKDASKHDSP